LMKPTASMKPKPQIQSTDPFDRIYVPFALETLPTSAEVNIIYDNKPNSISPNFTTDSAVSLRTMKPIVIQEKAVYSDAYLTSNPAEIASFDRVTVVFEFYRDDSTKWVL
jgi:hypothetical protein